jgi:zinc transport system ATP-binding protein
MKGLLGLIKPKSGEIIFDGFSPTEIGYLPQQDSSQKNFPASVYEVVISGRLSGRGIIPFYSKADKRIAHENMERLGVGNLRNKSFRELSGGQQQRVLLARALCAAKKAILLDEPAAGLDPLVTAELYAAIKGLSRDLGITVILISHDIRAAVEYAEFILHLKNEQLFFGKTEDYKETKSGFFA